MRPPTDQVLVGEVRAALRAAADPVRAPQMQRYMKSAMPFLGVPRPAVRGAVRAAAASRPPQTTDGLRATTLRLWREAAFREERYAATALTGLPIARRLQTPRLVPMYQEMITTGAWWDHVDELAGRIGALLLAQPAELRPVVRRWMRADDRWLRRASIICQRGAKERTDLDLLAEAIEASTADPDFFLRKAIGWALRSYAYTDAAWVRAFVAEHQGDLSPLSRREALKHIGGAQLRS